MKNITENFNRQYRPYKALLLYGYEQSNDDRRHYPDTERNDLYVESYDIGRNGQPINAHPLTIREMMGLADIFNSSRELDNHFLCSKGLLPEQVLYVDQKQNGFAIWYTPPMVQDLFFTENLGVPSGRAHLPALLWKASKDRLYIFALKKKGRPTLNAEIYHAPFLNIYTGGNVCMGTVNIDISEHTHLEQFIQLWQDYFFRSDFSHSINGNSSTKSDTVTLWRSLMGTDKPFPTNELVSNGMTLKNLLA